MNLRRGCCGLLAAASLLLVVCKANPWPRGAAEGKTLFTAMVASGPRHLEPTASYWSNEASFTYQIYGTPFGYHYLKRPYQLVPKLAEAVAVPRYIGHDGRELPADARADQVAESDYDIRIKPGVLYQPHPVFAKDRQGRYRYYGPAAEHAAALARHARSQDCPHQGTRELLAEDFVYALKRHPTTRITTPM